jgi:hypothetical protein
VSWCGPRFRSVESRHIRNRLPLTLCKLPSPAHFSSFRQLSPPSPLFALRTWTPLSQRNGDDSIASQQHVICAKHAKSNAMANCLARIAGVKITVTLAPSLGPNRVRRDRPQTRQLVEAEMLPEEQHLIHHTRNNMQTPPLLWVPSPMPSIQGTLRRPL